jgi:hypothetical protein
MQGRGGISKWKGKRLVDYRTQLRMSDFAGQVDGKMDCEEKWNSEGGAEDVPNLTCIASAFDGRFIFNGDL